MNKEAALALSDDLLAEETQHLIRCYPGARNPFSRPGEPPAPPRYSVFLLQAEVGDQRLLWLRKIADKHDLELEFRISDGTLDPMGKLVVTFRSKAVSF